MKNYPAISGAVMIALNFILVGFHAPEALPFVVGFQYGWCFLAEGAMIWAFGRKAPEPRIQ